MGDHYRVDIALPHLDAVVVDEVERHGDMTIIHARPTAVDARCPSCGQRSRSVHDRYQRSLADTPLAGQPVWVVLEVRRFVCAAGDCVRGTFVEQVPGLSGRYARRSLPLTRLLHRVAAALAGRAGSRMAAAMSIPVSRGSLIRLLRGADDPAVTSTPRVLGVDDFALRRGHVYATILIDIETHQPVDVLPDRTSETLAAWLRAHPGVEVICRDRASAYADGGRTGAPHAIQVADRFHLWANLGEAVAVVVVAHRGDLAQPAADQTPSAEAAQPVTAPAPSPAETVETLLSIRTRERYASVQHLVALGVSRAQMARQLGLDPHTVRRFATAVSVDDLLATGPRGSLLDAFKPCLYQRFSEGCTNARVLTGEIRQRGFTGTAATVRRYVASLRADTTRPPPPPPAPKPRQVTEWIMTKPDHLAPDDATVLEAIRRRSPAIDALSRHVQAFATMMCTLTGGKLPQWLKTVEEDQLSGLGSFAAGLRRDLAAVTNGLTLPWSSGAVEGHVNRIKMIKRQMFGRANFDLLRRRILTPT
jgi:transposase